MKPSYYLPLSLACYLIGSQFSHASAQITSDGTVNTRVTQNGNVSEITGGETRKSNLFHSFREFSVNYGNELITFRLSFGRIF
ncbi:two-partner secretion domain-containing protein [Myxosarcina sp. GI1(2024)]